MMIYKIVHGYITSNAMGWNLPCIIKLPYRYLSPIYHMDVRSIVCHDITNLYMYSNLTSYWTLMANSGHYMLNEYDNLHIGQKNNGNTCLPNENKQKTIITCNKLNRTKLKDTYLSFLMIFFQTFSQVKTK
jgi:hypothetical protein